MKRVFGGVPVAVLEALIIIGIGSAVSVAVRESGHPLAGGLPVAAAACVGGTLVWWAISRHDARPDSPEG